MVEPADMVGNKADFLVEADCPVNLKNEDPGEVISGVFRPANSFPLDDLTKSDLFAALRQQRERGC